MTTDWHSTISDIGKKWSQSSTYLSWQSYLHIKDTWKTLGQMADIMVSGPLMGNGTCADRNPHLDLPWTRLILRKIPSQKNTMLLGICNTTVFFMDILNSHPRV